MSASSRMRVVLAAASLLAIWCGGPLVVRAAALRPFVRGSWAELRRTHQGRPLIVHFWGVTCAPCMGELPKWGALARRNPGVDLVFVAADPEPVPAADIEAAAGRTGIGAAENWMFGDSFLERLRFEVNPRWGGELPFTVLVDATGHLSSVSGVMDEKDVRAWVDAQGRTR